MAEHTVEQGKEEEKEKHISIQRGSALPLLIQCTTCCRNFHCPFCDASIFKPTRRNKLTSHMKIHFKKAVVHGAGNPCFYHEEAGGTDVVMEDSTPAASMVTTGGMVCDIKQLSASRSCWDFQPSDWQSSMLNQILSKNDRDETIAQVGSIKLQRKDFLTLGLNAALEATIANSCLDVIVMVAKEKGTDVFAANSYVVVTWLPPLELDPFLSFPDNIGSKDYILLPAWMPGHWMLCVCCSLHFWVN